MTQRMLRLPGTRKGSILLWGPRESGKSTFLACLPLMPEDAEPGAPRWRVVPADGTASGYASDLLKQLQEQRSLKPTQVTEEPYRFFLQRPGRRLFGIGLKEWEISLLDPSGEVFEPQRLRTEAGRMVLDRVVHAAGLVILVDATSPDAGLRYWNMFADNIGVMVRAIREQGEGAGGVLDAARRLTIRTAVCLTKMDRADAASRADPAAFLRERLGSAHQLIKHSFTNYRVFACSALGAAGSATTPEGGPYELPRPWGLIEPFRWLVTPGSEGLL